ncbi:MAG: hypothetical protein K9N35_01265 [Candidatus Marinimicrobia bacterium]|nr:hypothetical protein [Candidatus Neomarinimicrobiota bacterium]
MIKTKLRSAVIFLLAIPVILLLIEVGIRIIIPQAVDEIDFGDIYTISYSPSLGKNIKSLKPGISRIKNGAEVHINSIGTRDNDYTIQKPDSVRRIAIVGSSIAFGLNLELDDTFGKKMETLFEADSGTVQTEVLLFGRPGFKARETYACIVDKVLAFEPDLIIYSFVQNNYEDESADEYFSRLTAPPIIQHQDAAKGEISILAKLRNGWEEMKDHQLSRYVRSRFHLYLFSANSIARILREVSQIEKEKAQNIAALNPNLPSFRKKIINTESWISLMNDACQGKGVKFAILMHPYEMQLNERGGEKWRLKGIDIPTNNLNFETHQIMKNYAQSTGIYFVDILPELRNRMESDRNYYLEGDYGHFNAAGHSLIAENLFKAVNQILAD